MHSNRRNLIAATVLALGGVFVAWRALDRASPAVPRRVDAEISEVVRAALDVSVFDTIPTHENFAQVERLIRSRAEQLAEAKSGSAAVAPSRRADLAAAFTEQLTALLSGDGPSHRRHLATRGYDASEQSAAAWDAGVAFTQFAPISLERAEIRVITEQGSRLTDYDTKQGFGVLTTEPGPESPRPVASDAVKGKLDIVEVRLPMQKRMIDGKSTTSLIGFQFAWSAERDRWVPWNNVIYCYPNERHAALPFY